MERKNNLILIGIIYTYIIPICYLIIYKNNMFSKRFSINVYEIKSSIKDGLIATLTVFGLSTATFYNLIVEMIKNNTFDWKFLIIFAGVFVFTTLFQMFVKWIRKGEDINSKMRQEMLDLPKHEGSNEFSE